MKTHSKIYVWCHVHYVHLVCVHVYMSAFVYVRVCAVDDVQGNCEVRGEGFEVQGRRDRTGKGKTKHFFHSAKPLRTHALTSMPAWFCRMDELVLIMVIGTGTAMPGMDSDTCLKQHQRYFPGR